MMRIASLISAATEMLFALGLGKQVVGISHECDWPGECQKLPRVTRSRVNSSASSAAIDSEVKSLMTSGNALYEIDVEQLSVLQPDFIVTQSQCDVCAVRYDDVIRVVQQTPQLTATQVLAFNPKSLAEILHDMRRIGEAAKISEHAEKVINNLERRVDQIRSTSAKIRSADRPRVAIIEWLEPLMLAGNWVPEIIEIAGGQCELTPSGRHSQYHSWEELLRFDPQVVVVAPCGFDLSRAKRESIELCNRPGWNHIHAVQSKRVFIVDGNACFNRPGPRLVESVELLASLLHPELHAIPPECKPLFCPFE